MTNSETEFVWAPHAERVTLCVGGHAVALYKQHSGWWGGEARLQDGDDYTFSVDDQLGLPDPRSRWQPSGVSGASRFVDHTKCVWTDDTWKPKPWSEAIVYELHIGTFTSEGTFEAAIKRLGYLQRLGITHVELLPIAQFPGDRGWGYDGVFPFAPQDNYGGPEGLKGFVDACHGHGLAVILDVVYNHVGPTGNVLAKFGPYFSESYNTPWGPGLNFDAAGSDEVRRYVCDNALMWLREYHVDGLRIDSIHEMVDSSAMHILEQLVREVRELEDELEKQFFIIGEDGKNNSKNVRPLDEGGYGFDAQWSNDVGLSLLAYLTKEQKGMLQDYGSWADLVKGAERPFVYERRYSKHRGHTFGRPAGAVCASKFVIYGQNHDFLGNRRDGDRLGHRVSLDTLKINSALTLLSQFTPLLFQGEEWNASAPFLFFADCHGNAALTESVKKGREMAAQSLDWKAEEAPDPGARATFERSKLNWNELEHDSHQEINEWYRSLISLRRRFHKSYPHESERFEIVDGVHPQLLAFKRGPLAVMCNLGEIARSVRHDVDEVVLLQSQGGKVHDSIEETIIEPWSVVIVGPSEWAARLVKTQNSGKQMPVAMTEH